ncbi:MAG: hypothetical protein JW791_01155 [Nanoarchaeota archaeon]|nr:hypothetical protein [Nanoarchaeota archaeon]
MKKVLISVLLLGLLIAIPVVNANSGSVDFQIDVTKDWTISMPALCDTASGNYIGVLEFVPGITPVDDAKARPIDSCAFDTMGDYNITNDGNVFINLSFSLDQDPAAGIDVVVGSWVAYDVANYTARLQNSTTQMPLWAQNISPAAGSDIVQVWQRVGVDDTVTGGSAIPLQLIITSDSV